MIAARAVMSPREPLLLRADHPFLFLIVDSPDQERSLSSAGCSIRHA